jgi:hypothetical protein
VLAQHRGKLELFLHLAGHPVVVVEIGHRGEGGPDRERLPRRPVEARLGLQTAPFEASGWPCQPVWAGRTQTLPCE